jgi:hypothetical protein
LSGKYTLAAQMLEDNPFLGKAVTVTTPTDMERFLKSPTDSIGIVYATSVRAILRKSQNARFGPVVFIPAPETLDSHGVDADWNDGSDC